MARYIKGVQWAGLDSFKDELHVLTADLVSEAEGIMIKAAFEAHDQIKAAYPARTGNLRAGLIVKPVRGTVLAGAELRQRAPHGWIYDHGTQPRATQDGANRGRMTGTPTFEPIAAAYRRTAISAITFRLYAHGATRVEGEPEA